jgi:hypothetical protein
MDVSGETSEAVTCALRLAPNKARKVASRKEA